MSTLLRTLFLFTLPLITLQQTPVKSGTRTDIVPFGSLPLCAQSCGVLFDVSYGCIPPAKPSVDTNCFCTDKRVSALSQAGASNTCATVCTVAADVTAIQTWFNSFCASGGTQPTVTEGGSPTATDAGSTETGDSQGGSENTPGDSTADKIQKNQSWIETHYQYVIMIVIIVVAIVGGWIAAAFFRRRYLRKRELTYEMRPPTAPWVTGHTGPTGPYGGGGFGESAIGKEAAMMTTPMTAAQVKKEKKKWIIGERS